LCDHIAGRSALAFHQREMEPISRKSQHHKLKHNAKVLPHYYIQFSLSLYLHFLVFSYTFFSSRLLFSLAKNLQQTDQRITQYVLFSTYIRQLHITSAARNQLYSKHQMLFMSSFFVLLKASIDQAQKIKGLTGLTKWFLQTEHQKHRISDLLKNKVTYRVSDDHPRVGAIHLFM
jgi:hypothetical protein